MNFAKNTIFFILVENLDPRFPFGFKLGAIVAVDWIWRFLMLPFLFLVTAEVDKWF